MEQAACLICYFPIESDDENSYFECSHDFHRECLKNIKVCPVCNDLIENVFYVEERAKQDFRHDPNILGWNAFLGQLLFPRPVNDIINWSMEKRLKILDRFLFGDEQEPDEIVQLTEATEKILEELHSTEAPEDINGEAVIRGTKHILERFQSGEVLQAPETIYLDVHIRLMLDASHLPPHLMNSLSARMKLFHEEFLS